MPVNPMPLSSETQQALQELLKIQQILLENEGSDLNPTVKKDLELLISVLSSPVLATLLNVQDSLEELKRQIHKHPSILPVDFDIVPMTGDLVLNLPLEATTPLVNNSDSYEPSSDQDQGNNQDALPSEIILPPQDYALSTITTEGYVEEFRRTIDEGALGREVLTIKLYKQDGSSLGFSVVGLQNEEQGELGIFVQEIQDNGIAKKDGRLQEGDQILAIDGQPLDSNISHQQAISILQQARGFVELVIARAEQVSSPPTNMVLSSECVQVESIDLVNDGSGLGFGIVGGKSTGVIVKTILPGGVADRDGRLRSGDHILRIGDVDLLRMGSEEVAMVLRQAGVEVRLLVARPVDKARLDLPVVPTRILSDVTEVERHLDMFQSKTEAAGEDMETLEVELAKDQQGLGITIAGYVCEKEEISGIFVKSIAKGSAADLCQKIKVNDQVIEVDGRPLHGYTNHQAVEVLRNTGRIVKLRLARYHKGLKYQQLQQAIASGELVSTPGLFGDTILTATSHTPPQMKCSPFSSSSFDKDLDLFIDDNYDIPLDLKTEVALQTKWGKIMGPDYEIVVAQICKFQEGGGLGISLEGTVDVEDGQEVRPHHYIRSILLDGPVGMNGKLNSGDELLEVNGKVLHGLNHIEVVGTLKDLPMFVRMVCARRINPLPDEGVDPSPPPLNYDVCSMPELLDIRTVIPAAYGGTLGTSGTSTISSLAPSGASSDRLVKAKSDGSLATPTDPPYNRLKSRSLEPLTGLAMWSTEPQVIQLVKGERGLGFSILDYQDPMNPSETVIVIRSLVPGGVAQQDGHLIPGDRLLFVNDIILENASLDTAVQALKGAAKGLVRIGVAKPLPLPDSNQINFQDPISIADFRRKDLLQGSGDLDQFSQTLFQETLTKPPPFFANTNVLPLPAALERVARIKKDSPFLGIVVEIADDGLNGVLVTSVSKGSIIHKDNQIRAGDYLLSINGESLRNISANQIQTLLQESESDPNDLIVKYIPASDAAIHHQNTILNLQQETEVISPIMPSQNARYSPEASTSPVSSPNIVPQPAPRALSPVTSSPSNVENIDPNKPTVPVKPPVPFKPKNLLERASLRGKLSPSPQPSEEVSPALPLTGPPPISSTPSVMWGSPRKVEVWRKPPNGLGISIIGGNVESLTGIFIKHVLPESSAGLSSLKGGDHILEVDGVSLAEATHAEAVQIIKQAKNPVTFVVKSLIPAPRKKHEAGSKQPSPHQYLNANVSLLTPPEPDSKLEDSPPPPPPPPRTVSQDLSLSSSSDTLNLDSQSASCLLPDELDAEEVDQFGYTTRKIKRKYGYLEETGEIVTVTLQKTNQSLGLSLAGNADRSIMSVFICGMNPTGSAAKDARLHVGDEILEVNGRVMKGKCHLNVSAAIKSIPESLFKIIAYRSDDNLTHMAVKPLSQFPTPQSPDESPSPSETKLIGVQNTRTVNIMKGGNGVGIMIIEGTHVSVGQGIFVSDIQPGSPAEQAGLNVGDMLLSVNNKSLIGTDYKAAASLLKQAEGNISLVVATPLKWATLIPSATTPTEQRKGASSGPSLLPVPSAKPFEPFPTSSPADEDTDSLTCPVIPGRETTIQILKENIGLGLSIVGGDDTPLGAIIIHEVYPDGAAYLDGRLKPGDQILEVNGEDLRNTQHEHAITVLRQTPALVTIVVYREEGHNTDDDLYDILRVELIKKAGKGLGLSIVGRKNGQGVYVSEVVKGGVADLDGRVLQGDQILEVNGKPMRCATQDFAAAILKVSQGKILLKLGRLKAGSRRSLSNNNLGSPRTEEEGSVLYKTIVLERSEKGLGFSIVGGKGSNHGDLPIYVKTVQDTGAAAEEGELKRGDQIVAVNDVSLEGMSHEEAAMVLKNAQGKVTLTIIQ